LYTQLALFLFVADTNLLLQIQIYFPNQMATVFPSLLN